jgi:hypothetical protein
MKTCVAAIGAASEVACACKCLRAPRARANCGMGFFFFYFVSAPTRGKFQCVIATQTRPCAFYHPLPLSSAPLSSSLLTFPSSFFLSMLLSLSLSLAFSNRFFPSISAQWCPAAAVQYAICAFCICTILIHTRAILLTLPRWPACVLRVFDNMYTYYI